MPIYLEFLMSLHQKKPVIILFFVIAATLKGGEETQSLYHNMIEANKAQIVMLRENNLLRPELAGKLAQALQQVAEKEKDAGTNQSGYPNYLDLEAKLVDLIGHEASNLHLGRSRNDLGATINRMMMRERLLGLLDQIASVRAVVLKLAGENIDTVMPGFTHAVQAQPTTLAHFLLAFDSALGRDSQRLREAYARINRSPLGSAAFNTSGFPLDRDRLAELLGFDGIVENSYDAIMVSIADSKVEFVSALATSALNVGRLAQYLIFQYDDPVPGMLLSDSVTGRSSIMPQKRSPSIIERLRLDASEVVGNAHTATLFVHNTPLYEVKDAREDHLIRMNRFANDASRMYGRLQRILESLTIRENTLRDLVDRDYSTMTELADALHREAGVPFRVGHHVASDLTTYGRTHGKTPHQLTWEEVDAVYREVTGESLPLSPDQLHRVFDAAEFVRSRKGRGGPQPESVKRMLAQQRQDLTDLGRWIDGRAGHLEKAAEKLDSLFAEIAL